MRNFWKESSKKGIENYMKTALMSSVWYSHGKSLLQKVELIPVRSEYANGAVERDLMRNLNYDSEIINKYKSQKAKEQDQPKKRVKDD